MRRARNAGVAALLILAACSRDRSEKIASELQTVRSWSSSSLLAVRAWRDNEAPPHYTLRVLELSAQADSQSLDALHQLAAPQSVQQQVSLTARVFPGLREAIEKNDRGIVSRGIDSLQVQLHTLDTLTQRLSSSQ